MSEVFDPYRKWLGIPPKEQPPNHYRLLGIALYENDPDVIHHAADRQMAHLRTFQGGKFADHSQRILNEVSAARLCLLNAEKKTAYDAELQQKLAPPIAEAAAAAPPSAPPPLAPPPPVSTEAPAPPTGVPLGRPVPVGVAAASPTPVVRTASRPRSTNYARGRKKSSSAPLLIGIAGLGLLAAGGLIVAIMGGASQTTLSTNPPTLPSSPTTTPPRTDLPPRTSSPENRTPEIPRQPVRTEFPAPATTEFPVVNDTPAEPDKTMSVAEIEAQAVETALIEARQKLGAREVEDANRILSNLKTDAQKAGKEAELEHLSTLQYYLKQFWTEGVRAAMLRHMMPGDSFEFRGDKVELVSVEETTGRVTYKFNGTEKTDDPRELATGPAIAFAWRSFQRENVDPYAYIYTAAFLALDTKSGLSENERMTAAKKFWQEAADAGANDKYVAKELGLAAGESGSGLPPAAEPIAVTPPPAEPAPAGNPVTPTPMPQPANPAEPAGEASIAAADELASARFQLAKSLRDRYGRDIPSGAKGEVVDLLLDEVKQATEPAKQYALWEKAAELTSERGDPAKLSDVLNGWSKAQPVSYSAKLSEYLPRCKPADTRSTAALLSVAQEGYQQAWQAGEYNHALKLAELALKAAAAAKNTDAVQAIRTEMETIEQQKANAGAVETAL